MDPFCFIAETLIACEYAGTLRSSGTIQGALSLLRYEIGIRRMTKMTKIDKKKRTLMDRNAQYLEMSNCWLELLVSESFVI